MQPPVASRSSGEPTRLSWVFLAVAVLSVASSAVLIRYARQAAPLAISFWRCAAGALALAPFARRGLRGVTRRSLFVPLLAGAFLAIHFASWITSLELTTVANSVLLVSTTPVFTALTARYLFRERLRGAVWLGIALTIGGTVLIAGAGGGDGEVSLSGNMLALLGAITVAGYTIAGGISRRQLGIVEYAVATYGAAALLLLPVCLYVGVPLFGLPIQTWAAIAGIVIGPQLLGHTLLNFVLRDLDPTTVTVAVMAEPPIAIILAFLLFSETPSVLVYPGGAAIVGGILLVSFNRRRAPEIIE